jgi:hypothetical protein
MSTSNYNYPDQFATNEQKKSESYGLEFARFIVSEWLTNGKFSKRNAEYQELDRFKNSEVSVESYKHMLGMCEDRIWTGMNWSFTSIAPKFINVIKDGFADDLFKIKAKAVDSFSRKERNAYRKKLEDDMYTSDFMRSVSAQTGTNYMPEYIPESEEEIDIHMQLKYRQHQEIAAELIINRVLAVNGWEEIQNNLKEDLITKGIAIVKTVADKDYGIIPDRVVPDHFICSYDTKSSRNGKGIFYFGEVREYTVDDVIRMSNGKLTMEDIKSSINKDPEYFKTSGLFGKTKDSLDSGDFVQVLYFCYKTTLDETYKRKRNKLIEKERGFTLPEESLSSVVTGKHDVWFEGYHIVNTNLIWGYRLMRDMIRPVDNINRVIPPFSVYQLSVNPVLKNIMPFCEDAHIAILKLRHLVLSMRPKGFSINIDALNQLDLGDGKMMTPIEIVKIFNQTGNLLYSGRGYDEEGKYTNVLGEIRNSIGSELSELIGVYNNAINMCYEVSGLNRVRDGSAPLAGALVGTQQIALSMSNTATKHILNGILSLNKDIAQVILNRTQQVTMYGESFSKEIMDVFWEETDETKERLSSSHEYRFDIAIEMAPDQNERQAMEVNIASALQSGQINMQDAIDLRTIDNIKLANEYLKIVIKKREKEKFQQQRQLVFEQQQAEAQKEIAIENAKAGRVQQEAQLESLKSQLSMQANNARIEKEVEGKLILMSQQFKYNMQLKGLDVESSKELNKFKEDAKDNRTKIQASQQSELIQQRQNGTGSIDFMNPNPAKNPGIEIPVFQNEMQNDPSLMYGEEQMVTNQ